MNKRFLYLLVPLLLFFGSRTTSHAQTTLAAGDIAFVMLNCNSSPQMTWAWVPLVDIASGTTIYFTDNGWNGTGFVYDYATLFSTITSQNDDQITFTTTTTLPKGTVLTFSGTNFSPSTYGTVSCSTLGTGTTIFPSSSSGDEFFAYQGTFNATTTDVTFIAGIIRYWNGSNTNYCDNSGWGYVTQNALAYSSLPSDLTNGTHAIAVANSYNVGTGKTYASGPYNFAIYTGSTLIGTKTELLAAINNYANWTLKNTTPAYTWSSGNFTVNASAVAPTVTTTTPASSIAATSATLGGNVTADGGGTVTERGVVYALSSVNTNPQIGGTGVTKVAYSSGGTGSFSQPISSLSQGTSYHYNAYATNSAGTNYGTMSSFSTLTAGTFTGATNSDWSTAANWAGGSVPNSATDVTIPSGKTVVIGATTSANCKNLTVTGSLTIQSSSSGTGSLIISGTSTGSVTCQRYMTGGVWHMVSPIATGGSISTFIQSAGNAIPLTGSNYGMMDYNETTNAWNAYFTTSKSGSFAAGNGYLLRRSSDGVVTFTGTLASETNTVAVTKGGTEGWNLIGNPYTSSIYMNTSANSSYNFLKTNAIDAPKLDASYACIYLWDVTSGTYKILGNSSYSGRDLDITVFAPGQAFFVKAASAGTVEFNHNMQVQQTGSIFRAPAAKTAKAPLISTSWPGISLKAASATTSSSTIVTFNETMTKGLDPTYDAGLLRGTNGLSLYTRLVEDNGVDFAIQCLPEEYSNLVIPVGVDCKDGDEITFSAKVVELPATCTVILEDRTANTFTSLEGDATYKATVSAGTTPVGRFYIHTSVNTTTGMSGLNSGIAGLKAYIVNQLVIIEGAVSGQATATLYDMQGQKLWTKPLQKGSLNTISCSDLLKGVYVLILQQNGETVTRKVVKE